MAVRRMELRDAGRCAICRARLEPGAPAEWDDERRTVTCIACVACLDGTPIVPRGVAGASARAHADRLHAARSTRREQIKKANPILGRIELAVNPLPDPSRSWAKGAAGEEALGARLDELATDHPSVLLLHDRRLSRSKANVDHLAVTPTGVWVIDAKRYDGLVAGEDRGGLFRRDLRLTVRGRDRTSLVTGVRKQVAAVHTALAGAGFDAVPVHGALCFIGADWPWFARPLDINGVLVAWGKAIRERLVAPGPLDAPRRDSAHRCLARAFPPGVAR